MAHDGSVKRLMLQTMEPYKQQTTATRHARVRKLKGRAAKPPVLVLPAERATAARQTKELCSSVERGRKRGHYATQQLESESGWVCCSTWSRNEHVLCRIPPPPSHLVTARQEGGPFAKADEPAGESEKMECERCRWRGRGVLMMDGW